MKLNILLSAYGCSPILGSEPGVGWRWALELSKKHQVTLITHPFFKQSIEQAILAQSMPNLDIEYVEPKLFGIRRKPGSLNSRLYYLIWQFAAYIRAKRLVMDKTFDVAHHITWGTFRFPSFLYKLNIPFVFGPVGGGEIAPLCFFNSLPIRERFVEIVRKLVITSACIDPFVRKCLNRADVIFCKTNETLNALPTHGKGVVAVFPEIGAPEVFLGEGQSRNSQFRLLFAGRLIGWKGAHLAIGAVAEARRRGCDVLLDFVGKGNLEGYLKLKVESLNLNDSISFKGHVQRDELMSMYASADVFLFPSLHDSSGNVVLEALSRGLPVICLDLGGPHYFIDESCGRVISTSNVDEEGLIKRIADCICKLSEDRVLVEQLHSGAIAAAQRQSWTSAIKNVYAVVEQVVRK